MEPLPLREYRCDCGKLLFKGMLAISFVEVKCRRCGRLKMMTGLSNNIFDDESCVIMIDKSGDILNSSRSIVDVLGVNHNEVVGNRFDSLPINLPDRVYRNFINLDHDIYIKLKTFSGSVPIIVMLKTFNLHDRRYALVSINKNIDPGSYWKKGMSGLRNEEKPSLELDEDGRISFIDDELANVLGPDRVSEMSI